MAHTICKFMISIIISAALIISSIQGCSVEEDDKKEQASVTDKTQSNNDINGLEVARHKLKNAIDNYTNGDLEATRRDLDTAIEWLNKSSQNSKTETSRKESRQLAAEIDDFKKQLNQSSADNENALVRFWHQSTAIIGREIDQLIHSYIELSTTEKILKKLLDAKMYLYTAEHDLFVSHDAEDSTQELDRTLEYLDEANQMAKKPLQKKITDLSNTIRQLKEQVKRNPEAWKKNDEIMFLDKTKGNLARAKEKSSPQTRLRIESIEADIQSLKTDIEKNNIKNNYETSLATLINIINEL